MNEEFSFLDMLQYHNKCSVTIFLLTVKLIFFKYIHAYIYILTNNNSYKYRVTFT